MNFYKAFFFTALLVAIEVAIYFVFEILQPQLESYITIENFSLFGSIQRIIAQFIAYITIFILFFKTTIHWNREIEIAKNLHLKTLFFVLVVAVGLEFLDRPFFDFSKIINNFNNVQNEPLKNASVSIFTMVGALIIAPVFEEVFFRRLLFRELLKKYSLQMSILVSSSCFALVHLPSYRNLIPTFIFGIISCIIYHKTKNIIYSISLHFLANLSWLTLAIYGDSFHNWVYSLEFNLVYWILFLMGMLLTVFGLSKITTANNDYG